MQYLLAVRLGNKKISLSTFPLYTTLDLRYAISIAGSTHAFVSIKTTTESNMWGANVILSYAIDVFLTADVDKEIMKWIFFADSDLVLY